MATLENTDTQQSETDFTRLKKLFEEARDNTQDARDEAMTALGYFHGKQWTSAEIAELKRRRQPVVTYNLIKPKIASICGIEENSKTDPKAVPRTPQDENAANVATDVLRYVTERDRFPQSRINVLQDTLICGIGGAIVEVEPGESEGDAEIRIRQIRYENIVYDPYSREADFSDARYLGIAKWLDEADAIKIYGEDAQEVITNTIDGSTLSSGSTSYEDRPLNAWGDRKRRRCLIVELYHLEQDGWYQSVFTGAGLIASNPSMYQDAKGQTACPIILTSCYVDADNNRYGLIRDMRSPQDEINHRRSKLLHLLNTRQTFRKEGAIASRDPQKMRSELNKPDGDVVIAKNAVWGQDAGIIDTTVQFQGQAELLAEAKSFLDQIGPNNSLAGVKTESQSGRAILAQQQAGLAVLATIFAAHNDWILRIYRQIWACARQFWTSAMYIRVTDDMNSHKFIYVNEVVGVDPQAGTPIIRNRLAEMGVDLEVERVPHTANLQQEQFEIIGKILLENPDLRSPETLAALISNSTIRDKKALIDAVTQPPPPQVVELQQRGALAEVAEKEASTKDKEAAALLKTAQAQKLVAEASLMNLQNSLGMTQQAAPIPQGVPMPQEHPPVEQMQQPMMPPQPMEPPIPEPPQLYGDAVPLGMPIEEQTIAPPQSGVF